MIEPGITTLELDLEAESYILSKGAKPGFKGLYGYPSTICVSIDDEVVHGLPSNRKLSKGELLSLDVGSYKNGFYGDHARSFSVGKISDEKKQLMDITLECLKDGIEKAVPGNHIGDIGFAHGHAWPSQEVMNSRLLIVGHEHPALSFRDRVDKLHSESCWLRAPMLEHERYDKVPEQLIVMPAFGELAGRTMNREPLKGLGPILRNGMADLSKARVETLEGLDFGELGNLIDLRL